MPELQWILDENDQNPTGTVVTNPFGEESLEKTIARDIEGRRIRIEADADVTFYADAYTLLAEKYKEDPSQLVTFRVKRRLQGENFITFVSGTIILNRTIWDITRRTAQTNALNISVYGQYINDSPDTNIYIGSGIDINGNEYTPAQAFGLRLFNPDTGVYFGNDCHSFDFLDAMQDILDYYTGGTVPIVSNWYNSLPNNERIAVTLGQNIRTLTLNTDPLVNYDLMLKTIGRLYNLWLEFVEISDGVFEARLEQDENTRIDQITQLEGIDLNDNQIASSLNYSAVEIGSQDYEKDPVGVTSFPYIPFLSHTRESYVLQGVNGGQSKLDLTTDYSTDHGAIIAALNGDTDYDDNVFFIQYDPTVGPGSATQTNVINPSAALPVIYNNALLNTNVAQRWNVGGAIAANFGDGNDEMQASRTADGPILSSAVVIETPLPFNDDSTPPNFDPNDNWDTVANEYTCPESGVYYVRIVTPFEILDSCNLGIKYNVKIFRKVGGAPIDNIETQFGIFNGVGLYRTEFLSPIYCNAGDTIDAVFSTNFFSPPDEGCGAPFIQWQLKSGATFEIIQAATSGGIINPADPPSFTNIRMNFTHPLSDEQFNLLANKPLGFVKIIKRDQQGNPIGSVKGWISRVVTNAITGETDHEYVTSLEEFSKVL